MSVRKRLTVLAALMATAAIVVVPAGAITDGQRDGNLHPRLA